MISKRMGRRSANRGQREGEPCGGLERPVVAGAAGSEAVAFAAARADPAKAVAAVIDLDWAAEACSISGWKAALPRVSGQLACSADDDGKHAATRMEAANVFTVPLRRTDIALARSIFESLCAVMPSRSDIASRRWAFHVERPGWKSDIAWVAANDAVTFRSCFQMLFDRLEVPRLFGFLGEMVLFSGFFVSRKSTAKSHFHTDFSDTGNRAFTLMTPLYDMSGLADCQLLCRLSEEVLKQYRYQLGHAIVFGDQFVHATETGAAPRTLAFLCFVCLHLHHLAAALVAPCAQPHPVLTCSSANLLAPLTRRRLFHAVQTFGERRMSAAQWANAEAYIEAQSPIYQNPAGELVHSMACAAALT